MEVKILLDFLVWGGYNNEIIGLEKEPALFVLKIVILIVMKSFFGGPSELAKAVPDKYNGNGDFNSCLSDRSYLMIRAAPVHADKILL